MCLFSPQELNLDVKKSKYKKVSYMLIESCCVISVGDHHSVNQLFQLGIYSAWISVLIILY